MTKPLFIPLKAEYYYEFVAGWKDTEYRVYGPHWNESTCWLGRPVTISKGYGKQERRTGVVAEFRKSYEPCRTRAWIACYPDNPGPAACIRIELDPEE